MDALALAKLSLKPKDAAQEARAEAEKVAHQFEAVFVKTLVGALRSTASVGGEGGGMFGDGPGADTYAGWFDQNVADHLAETGGLGVASAVLSDMERHGALASEEQTSGRREAASRLRRAAEDGERLTSANAKKGGFDVVL
jgi:flagellar protein FlgJ